MKYVLLLTLLTIPTFTSHKLSGPQVSAPARLGSIQVERTENGYLVNNQEVQPQNLDKNLRSMNVPALKAALKNGYVQVNQSTNGDYKLSLNGRLKGGGFAGAAVGFWFGKLVTHGIVQGFIVAVSAGAGLVGGPAAASWAWGTLEKTLWIPTEIASNKVGLGMGIIFGAGTGPV